MRSIAARLAEGWQGSADPAWLEGWVERDFELPGGTTRLVVMGEGPPLLLLPPLPGFKEAYVACARHLARRFRVVTYDLRSVFDGRPRWETLLDDLRRVVDATAPGLAAIAGHSMGGALAQRFALAHPERVASLVLSSSFARIVTPRSRWRARYLEQPAVLAVLRLLPEPRALDFASRLAARGGWVFDPRCDRHVLGLVVQGVRRVPLGLALERVRLAFDHDTRADLPRIGCRSLVIVGERESAAYRSAAAELERLIPRARLEVSPGAGHLHPLSNPEWFAATIGGCLIERSAR
jgi:pimeloyl-ACP methyl ester carboxylesterase